MQTGWNLGRAGNGWVPCFARTFVALPSANAARQAYVLSTAIFELTAMHRFAYSGLSTGGFGRKFASEWQLAPPPQRGAAARLFSGSKARRPHLCTAREFLFEHRDIKTLPCAV